MKAYLSSTLRDLLAERQAVRDVLGGECAVKESYIASEHELSKSCMEDVAACDVYIGVVGLRYGYQPNGADQPSITELEYAEAVARRIPRLIFVKCGGFDHDHIDADRVRIDALRKRVALDQRPAEFKSVPELREAVLKGWAEFKSGRGGASGLFKGVQAHPCEIEYELSIGCVPGSNDKLREDLSAAVSADRRIELFALSPADPSGYLARLDRAARRTRAVLLPVTVESWPRLKEKLDMAVAAVATAARRAPVFGLALGLTRAELGAEWTGACADVLEMPADAWSAAHRGASLDALRRWLRERLPESPARRRIGVPSMVLTPTLAQAQALAQDDAMFDRFGAGASLRRKVFGELRLRVQDGGLQWPQDFYGTTREDWRPFGPAERSVRGFVDEAVRRANAAPEGSRGRRRLLDRDLQAQWYGFDEFERDRHGSRDNLKTVCESGCLVLLDEFALLHPALRDAIAQLLVSNNVAVVALSACDPQHSPLHALLDDVSHLNLGNLRDRFRNVQDPCCELAVNSIPRLERWLHLVLPELLSTLGRQQSDPDLVQRAAALFAP